MANASKVEIFLQLITEAGEKGITRDDLIKKCKTTPSGVYSIAHVLRHKHNIDLKFKGNSYYLQGQNTNAIISERVVGITSATQSRKVFTGDKNTLKQVSLLSSTDQEDFFDMIKSPSFTKEARRPSLLLTKR